MAASRRQPLVTVTDDGLHCAAGGFHIDPWRPVGSALLTHAHSDHASSGSQEYRAVASSLPILRHRLGADAPLEPVEYGEVLEYGDTRVSFHPAGHVLGSAQIRIEHRGTGEVWVVSGDYKRAHDPTCAPFEVVPCDVFITEATFGLPIYRWRPGAEVAREVLAWWDENAASGRPSVLCCYALGKSQRLLAELAALTDRTVLVHGALVQPTEVYRAAGIRMLPTEKVDTDVPRGKGDYAGRLVMAPPAAAGSPWIRRFKNASVGFASGWMQVRGQRRRKGFDRGFVLSDHADWPDLVRTCRETKAKRVLVTHGDAGILARHLGELGIEALPLKTAFQGEGDV